MAARPAPRPATYADIEALPRNYVGEILYGVLHAHARPALPHAEVSSTLGEELRGFHRRGGSPGGWLILDEPELHLGPDPDVVVPDLGGLRRTRMPQVPAAAFTTLAPDWVAEIISASTEAEDRGEKMSIYAREKVAHAWLIDPLVRTLEVFRLDGETWRMIKTWHGDVRVRAEPFDAVELDLALLWESLPPKEE